MSYGFTAALENKVGTGFVVSGENVVKNGMGNNMKHGVKNGVEYVVKNGVNICVENGMGNGVETPPQPTKLYSEK